MKRKDVSILLSWMFTALLVFSLISCEEKKPPKVETPKLCQRVISMAPSITETLFAMGMGDRVAGVTRFCKFPKETANIAKVGGYMDTDYEAILTLKPDLVVLLNSHTEAEKKLKGMGIDTLKVGSTTINDIVLAFMKIGSRCGEIEVAQKESDFIKNNIAKMLTKTASLKKKTVLIAVGRQSESGGVKDVFVAGKGGFYDRLIDIAGGTNIIKSDAAAFPKLQLEGIITLNPDIIIEIAVGKTGKEEQLKKEWNTLSMLKAVKNHNVHIITEDHAAIPGPRLLKTAEDFLNIIHPEVRKMEGRK